MKQNKKQTISACLVIHNEERCIKRCLDSLKDVVDEIIVVHSGKCTDKTLEICKKYTKKIFMAPDQGVADPNRPLSFSKATKDWILRIDGDEFLSSELKKNIKKLVNDKDINGYELKWDFYNHNGKAKYMYKLALFRKSKMLPFIGIPHEYNRIKGKVVKSEFELGHKPGTSPFTLKSFKTKIKWTKTQAKYMQNKNIFELAARIVLLPPFYFFYDSIRYFNVRIGFFTMVYNYALYFQIIKLKLFNNS